MKRNQNDSTLLKEKILYRTLMGSDMVLHAVYKTHPIMRSFYWFTFNELIFLFWLNVMKQLKTYFITRKKKLLNVKSIMQSFNTVQTLSFVAVPENSSPPMLLKSLIHR